LPDYPNFSKSRSPETSSQAKTDHAHTDEAGFDVLIGSTESQVPSALYSEKVCVMSKAFVKRALSDPPQSLGDIIDWLYLTPPTHGPTLLRRVVEDSRRLLPENMTIADPPEDTNVAEQPGISRTLSAGALILLRRNLAWLEDFLKHHEERGGRLTTINSGDSSK